MFVNVESFPFWRKPTRTVRRIGDGVTFSESLTLRKPQTFAQHESRSEWTPFRAVFFALLFLSSNGHAKMAKKPVFYGHFDKHARLSLATVEANSNGSDQPTLG